MNESSDTTRQRDARLMDLLVDGELNEQDRRELLARLDDTPGGWRRCALAFLESQDWRRELKVMAREPALADAALSASSAEQAPVRGRSIRGEFSRIPWSTGLAMAASFLLAFALGLTWRGARPEGPLAGPGVQDLAGNSTRIDQPPETLLPPDEQASSQQGFETLTLAVKGPSGVEHIQAPVVAVDRYDPSWFEGQPSRFPAEMIQKLRNAGHRVEQYRELVPVDLDDGRKLVLPVDQVEVRFVDYQ